jgi:ribosomal protein S18 acetylase RimI-like enzyme
MIYFLIITMMACLATSDSNCVGASMESIEIITLPVSRWAEYRALRLEALKNDPAYYGRTYQEDAALPDTVWQKRLADSQDAQKYLVVSAQHEEKLVGMAVAWFDDHGGCMAHRVFIHSVYVTPEYRNKGVGKKMMLDLLARLEKDPRIVQIRIETITEAHAAVSLYERLGFKIAGLMEKELFTDGQFRDAYVMTKIVR